MRKITSLFWTILSILILFGCGSATPAISGNDIYADESGYAIGAMNDTMHTYFLIIG